MSNQFRILLLKLTATIAALLAAGCNMPTNITPVKPQPIIPPTPQQITLRITIDGEGKVTVGGGAEVKVGAGAVANTPDLPEVLAYCSPNWPDCECARRELTAANLPFRIIWKDSAPDWVTRYPTFHWKISGNEWRQRNQWDGAATLIDIWKRSQPTKVSAAASRPFAQPDRSSIGSRSVALWSISGDFTPSRSVLLAHLTNDGIHRGRHDRAMLESLTTEQLRWLHDRDHQGR